MADLVILDVPDDIVAQLRTVAAEHGRSIEAQALELVRHGFRARLSAEERLARSREYLRQSGGPHAPLTKDEIRQGAD